MPQAPGCPECGFLPSKVSPSDAAVAARSFPRRFRGLLVRPDEEDPDVVHRRPADGAPSAAEHALAAAASLDVAATALARVRAADDADVDLTPAATPSRLPLEAVLDRVAAAAVALAATAEAMHGADWGRTGHLPDGTAVTALDVARSGVHAGAHHLRAAERTLSAVR